MKRILFRVFYYSGAEWLLARFLPVNAAAVIMYHGVCDSSRLPPEIDFHISSADFDRHIRMLERRYPIVSLHALLDSLKTGQRLSKQIVLTFDDGYRNNASHAHPILESHRVPYAVFLATAFIGGPSWMPLNELYGLWYFGRIGTARMKELRSQVRRRPSALGAEIVAAVAAPLTPDERSQCEDSFAMLDWDQVAALARRGVEFGSHTHTHCNMAVEAPDVRQIELDTARDLIRSRLNREPSLFAYPFGRPENWSTATRQAVIHAGHRCAILAGGGLVAPGSDPFALPRIVYSKETWYFACELTLLFLKRWLRRA